MGIELRVPSRKDPLTLVMHVLHFAILGFVLLTTSFPFTFINTVLSNIPLFFALFILAVFLWSALLNLWLFFGYEIVRIEGETVRYDKTVFGIGRRRQYSRHFIKRFQFNPYMSNKKWDRYGLAGGKIEFYHGSKRHSFGRGLSDEEAHRVIAQMKRYFKD